jgi:hypothetical protein
MHNVDIRNEIVEKETLIFPNADIRQKTSSIKQNIVNNKADQVSTSLLNGTVVFLRILFISTGSATSKKTPDPT